jgi:hypothetical protein
VLEADICVEPEAPPVEGIVEEPVVPVPVPDVIVEEPVVPVPEPDVMVEDPVDPVPVPVEPIVEEPAAPGAMVDPDPVAPGCMAGEPEVVEPVPEATGRSVPAEGGGGFCAKAGAAAKAVATRQAAICFFSIEVS